MPLKLNVQLDIIETILGIFIFGEKKTLEQKEKFYNLITQLFPDNDLIESVASKSQSFNNWFYLFKLKPGLVNVKEELKKTIQDQTSLKMLLELNPSSLGLINAAYKEIAQEIINRINELSGSKKKHVIEQSTNLEIILPLNPSELAKLYSLADQILISANPFSDEEKTSLFNGIASLFPNHQTQIKEYLNQRAEDPSTPVLDRIHELECDEIFDIPLNEETAQTSTFASRVEKPQSKSIKRKPEPFFNQDQELERKIKPATNSAISSLERSKSFSGFASSIKANDRNDEQLR